jgi:hypothetical protein
MDNIVETFGKIESVSKYYLVYCDSREIAEMYAKVNNKLELFF